MFLDNCVAALGTWIKVYPSPTQEILQTHRERKRNTSANHLKLVNNKDKSMLNWIVIHFASEASQAWRQDPGASQSIADWFICIVDDQMMMDLILIVILHLIFLLSNDQLSPLKSKILLFVN